MTGEKIHLSHTWQHSEKDPFMFPVKITRGIWNYTWQILPGLKLLLSYITEVVSHKTVASAVGTGGEKSHVINWILTLFMSEIQHRVSLSLDQRRSEWTLRKPIFVCLHTSWPSILERVNCSGHTITLLHWVTLIFSQCKALQMSPQGEMYNITETPYDWYWHWFPITHFSC